MSAQKTAKTADKADKENKNGTMLQCFEWYLPSDSSLWKKIEKDAANLADMGFTSIWMPPATKGAFGDKGTGYAVYDVYDLGEFDQKGSVATKYGTKDEYIDAIKACHKAGIGVYADTVLDHKIGADEAETLTAEECASTDRTLPTSGEEQIKAWTKFTFPGRKGKYSYFIWDSTCFDGVDWDDNRKKNAVYLFQGHNWNSGVNSENGNYDYLMGADIDFDSQKVCDELTKWGKRYLDTTGIDGFRLDAVKHIKAGFYKKWLTDMREYSGKPLFTVGEYWNRSVGELENYLGMVNGEMSLFDVPLHFNLFAASNDGYNFDMRNILNGSLVAENPTHAVTFVDNHDTQPGQALCSYVRDWFRPMAYAIILLREGGYPCVFGGDLSGIPHDNIAQMRDIGTLLKIRSEYAYGTQHDYFDDSHCIGWTREKYGIAVIMSAHGDSGKTMYVGLEHAGKTYRDILGNKDDTVTIGADGNAMFPVKDGTLSVWMNTEDRI